MISPYAYPGIKNYKPASYITPADIVMAACDYYSVVLSSVQSKSRSSVLVRVRQQAAYISRKHYRHTLKSISESINYKDHTTVIHSVNKAVIYVNNDQDYLNDILNIIEKIKRV